MGDLMVRIGVCLSAICVSDSSIGTRYQKANKKINKTRTS